MNTIGFEQMNADSKNQQESKIAHLYNVLRIDKFDLYFVLMFVACMCVLCYSMFIIGLEHGKKDVIETISKSGYTYVEKSITYNGTVTNAIEIVKNCN